MSGDEDPWGFLAKKPSARAEAAKADAVEADSAEGESAAPEGATPSTPAGDSEAKQAAADEWGIGVKREPREKREHGEFRADMGGVSLRRRAWPMAFALALIAVAGFLTETVAASQVLSIAGPKSLLWIYPLGGLGLIALALLQFRYVDQAARLTVLRWATLGYAVVFVITLVFVHAHVWTLLAVAIIWLLADQLNFLMPILVWSLAGDEFNVAEARKVFGWIVSVTYIGQVAGLLVATFSPAPLDAAGIPLTWLLVIDPIVCVFIGLWLPRKMRGTFAARGTGKPESLKESLAGAADFINGVPIWRLLLLGSTITFAAGTTCVIAYMSGIDEALDGSASTIQVFFGATALFAFVVNWLLQTFAAERIQEKLGIPGTLLILPFATILSALALTFGILLNSLPLLALGLAAWFIPRWSLDENARRSALALVPDERRTRVSFVVDLVPISTGLIISGPVAFVGLAFDKLWLVPVAAGIVAVVAIPPLLKVRRGWEESLLNWRLRRRKQNRTLDFG